MENQEVVPEPVRKITVEEFLATVHSGACELIKGAGASDALWHLGIALESAHREYTHQRAEEEGEAIKREARAP